MPVSTNESPELAKYASTIKGDGSDGYRYMDLSTPEAVVRSFPGFSQPIVAPTAAGATPDATSYYSTVQTSRTNPTPRRVFSILQTLNQNRILQNAAAISELRASVVALQKKP